jgi:hypothetical protein
MRNCVRYRTGIHYSDPSLEKGNFLDFSVSFQGGIDDLILKRCLPNVRHLCTVHFYLSELRLYRYFVLGSVFSLGSDPDPDTILQG